MLNENSLEKVGLEELEKKSVYIVVEDNRDSAQVHKRNLVRLGLDVIILRGIGDFTKQIAEIKKTHNVVGVITDGLHGNWVSVHEGAIKNGIEKIWLISGNEDMINISKYFPYTRSISKSSLRENPDQYKMFLDAVKR